MHVKYPLDSEESKIYCWQPEAGQVLNDVQLGYIRHDDPQAYPKADGYGMGKITYERVQNGPPGYLYGCQILGLSRMGNGAGKALLCVPRAQLDAIKMPERKIQFMQCMRVKMMNDRIDELQVRSVAKYALDDFPRELMRAYPNFPDGHVYAVPMHAAEPLEDDSFTFPPHGTFPMPMADYMGGMVEEGDEVPVDCETDSQAEAETDDEEGSLPPGRRLNMGLLKRKSVARHLPSAQPASSSLFADEVLEGVTGWPADH